MFYRYSYKELLMRLKWAFRMVFAKKRDCENCGNSYYGVLTKRNKCLVTQDYIEKANNKCGDWRPA